MHPSPQRQGFALVIALSLMAFVLLLLLSLTSLVQVEGRSAKIAQSTLAARQNALLGLQEALGTLQQTAGPDQRVTATGSLWSNPQSGTEHLVGVWSSEDADNDGLPDGTFQRWLVSRVDPTQAEAIDFVSKPMKIGINGSTYINTATDHVVLVGEGSVAQDPDTPTAMQGVVAQKKPTTGNSGQPEGNYAWWVGDEGVKASISITNPKAGTPSPILSMPRFAPESIETLDFIPANNSILNKLQSSNDLIYLTGATEDAIRGNFHTIAHQSWGVQSSTRNGGLKKDLSLLFEMDEDSWKDSDFVANSPTLYKDAPVVGDVPLMFLLGREQKIDSLDVDITVGDNKLYGPTWNTLRDYYRSYKAVTDRNTTPTIQARAAYPAVSDMPYSTHTDRWGNSSSRQQMRESMGHNAPATSTNATNGSSMYGSSDQAFVRTTGVTIAPYLCRMTLQVSIEVVKDEDGSYDATWVLVPVLYLHNPYNISIATNQSRFLWDMTKNVYLYNINGGSAQEFDVNNEITFDNPLWTDGSGSQAQFILPPSIFRPGEVIAFTPIKGDWGTSVQMQRADSEMDINTPGGDGLRLPQKKLQGINSNEDILRTLYVTQGWVKFAWEMQNNNGDYDTMNAIMCMDAEKLVGFNWRAYWEKKRNKRTENLNRTISWTVKALDGVRTPITTFDIYVKPVDLAHPASTTPNLETLAFPSFVASNPLSSGEDRFSAATQGSALLSPLRNGYVEDGSINIQIISDGINGEAQGFWGMKVNNGSSFASILDVPTAPIHSLGHLQHANLLDQPHYPALAIGNSFPSPFLENNTSLFNTYWKNFQHTPKAVGQKSFYDLSYLTNRALWDDYFFSTIAPEESDSTYNNASPKTAGNVTDMLDAVLDGQRTLHNPRMQIHKDASEATSTTKSLLSDYKTSASRLMVNGAFNINSTSVAAWRAFLAGLKDADIQRSNQGSLVADEIVDAAAFLRHSIPNGSAVIGDAYTDHSSWTGFRALSERELDALADAIVDEIQLRALELGDNKNPSPFGSLSNFVNRMPYANNAEYTQLGLLQAAINNAGLNDRFNSATEFDTKDWNDSKAETMNAPTDLWQHNQWNNLNRADFANPDCRISTASAASTYLLQSDILQQIAPYISTRSDTFKIRSYGEHLDPITGESEGKAWLEAVVQRSPVPVKPSASNPQEPETPNSMGRRFEIVSLRWLSQEDI